MSADALAELVAAAEDAGIAVISDEIYHGLDYAFPAKTARSLSDRGIVINSFSKYFCMTGWRVGWMIAPETLVRPIERLHQNLAISVPTLSQIAAEAAFDGRSEMEAVKRGYEVNRRILMEGLPKAGLDRFLPVDGAFYLYADVSAFTDDSLDFARRLLAEAHVAATPGIDFDPVDGRRFIRFCYAGAQEDMCRGRYAHRRLARAIRPGCSPSSAFAGASLRPGRLVERADIVGVVVPINLLVLFAIVAVVAVVAVLTVLVVFLEIGFDQIERDRRERLAEQLAFLADPTHLISSSSTATTVIGGPPDLSKTTSPGLNAMFDPPQNSPSHT